MPAADRPVNSRWDTSSTGTNVRRSDFDITNTVRVSSPQAVLLALEQLTASTWPNIDMQPVRRAFADFEQLFAGRMPGYAGVDTIYHDRQHTLDVTLAMGRLVAGYLPQVGLGAWVDVARQIVHFTGYERAMEDIVVEDARDLRLGHLLGTADMIAQMADRCYLEKCRDRL